MGIPHSEARANDTYVVTQAGPDELHEDHPLRERIPQPPGRSRLLLLVPADRAGYGVAGLCYTFDETGVRVHGIWDGDGAYALHLALIDHLLKLGSRISVTVTRDLMADYQERGFRCDTTSGPAVADGEVYMTHDGK